MKLILLWATSRHCQNLHCSNISKKRFCSFYCPLFPRGYGGAITGGYLNYRKTRVHELSEADLVDLKNKKGVELNLVQGLKYGTFKTRGHTFHHLNFKATHHDELSSRLYFAEVINVGGAYCVTFCCAVDPADKVLEICRFCHGRGVIQPDISSMDLITTKNVIYVDLKLGKDLQSQKSRAFPCFLPSLDRIYHR